MALSVSIKSQSFKKRVERILDGLFEIGK